MHALHALHALHVLHALHASHALHVEALQHVEACMLRYVRYVRYRWAASLGAVLFHQRLLGGGEPFSRGEPNLKWEPKVGT